MPEKPWNYHYEQAENLLKEAQSIHSAHDTVMELAAIAAAHALLAQCKIGKTFTNEE